MKVNESEGCNTKSWSKSHSRSESQALSKPKAKIQERVFRDEKKPRAKFSENSKNREASLNKNNQNTSEKKAHLGQN